MIQMTNAEYAALVAQRDALVVQLTSALAALRDLGDAFLTMLNDIGGQYGDPHVGTEDDWIIERITTYKIEIAFDNAEAEQFAAWLNGRGHSAHVGATSGSCVDGKWTASDDEAREILNELWDAYCADC